MATAPVLGSFTDVFTMGALAARVKRKINEPMGPDRMADLYEDINDAIESIWISAMLATLSKFVKGPVNQQILANTTQTELVSVPDPLTLPIPNFQAGGIMPARTLYLSYCLVTDSGSTTLCSPLVSIAIPINSLAMLSFPNAPEIIADTIGWYVFAGTQSDGSDQGMQSPGLMQFGKIWFEPPAGITPAPQSPSAPLSNNTGDNIFAINRMDVQNIDQTWTNWVQSNIGASRWTEYGHNVPTATTWQPFVYDLIDNRQLTYRPGPNYTMTATYFYINKPRRLRFPQSRLPFTSFSCHAFLFAQAMFLQTLGIYETDVSDRWSGYAEKERQRIVLQISAESWNRDTTVRPFMH